MELACPYWVASCLYTGDFARTGLRKTHSCAENGCILGKVEGVKKGFLAKNKSGGQSIHMR